MTSENLVGFGYLAVLGAIVAYAVWFRGIDRLPAIAVSFLGFLSPLTATILGFAYLKQTLNIIQIFGALLILASVVVAQQASQRSAPSHAKPAASTEERVRI